MLQVSVVFQVRSYLFGGLQSIDWASLRADHFMRVGQQLQLSRAISKDEEILENRKQLREVAHPGKASSVA